ncbi:MAG TPA: sigma 54-interacting transcriptional regulator [Polyangiaceae bacterium]|nr:sigma 54-interacting transcriptional regulator [Polyangiaceae bacterium]
MDDREIRAIRGSLSRAAFARLLGVTSLTVLRWELPDDNKEARRPRARMVEALRRLATEGVGTGANGGAVTEPEDEEDEDASEPIDAPMTVRSVPPPGADATPDELLVLPLLERLMGETWPGAEDDLMQLLSSNRLQTPEGRTLATLGLIQVQIIARLDARGALMALAPILDEVERGSASRIVAARAHLMAALLFGAPDSRLFDAGRVNAHAARADGLLDKNEDDLRVLLATARISAARFLGPSVVLRAYQADLPSLERAQSSLPRFFAHGLHALKAFYRGDEATNRREGEEALAIGERLALWPVLIVLFADWAWRSVNGSATPEKVLEITQMARQRAKEMALAPAEPMLRILACEIEALTRLARFSEADAVVEEANQLAKRGGIVRYALAIPVARLYIFTNRNERLEPWAESLEAETAGSGRPLAGVHALAVRGMVATFAGELERASELLSQVCNAPETTTGIDYLRHHAHFEYTLSRLLQQDVEGGKAAVRRAHEYLEQHPSAWHSAVYTRMESFLLLAAGQFSEARKKAETTLAIFKLLGDKVQTGFARANLAMVARASGAPDAEKILAEVLEELKQLGVWSPQLLRRAQIISQPVAKVAWREETMTERLVGALDRLSVRGLSHDQYRRGLAIILGELFPGRETRVGGSEIAESDPGIVQVPDLVDGVLRFGVRGELNPEELAALRVLAAFVPKALGNAVAAEPEELDQVLPHFIAAAPATRKLKSEISRLSKSSATILIGGESGTGKEVVARAVHDLSARADKPYIVFNCASVPRDLFESQLFGYRRGAFTGATSDSPGVIRAADGGTLFLDEIGELPLDMQPKLLRFLENAEVTALGEQKPRRVDVRVLAATHRDLDRLVRDGRFREDLYYRLNVVPLFVPALRDRKEDIVALARMFIGRLAPDPNLPPELAADAIQALRAHGWPGNVRELRNVIERAMAYAPVPEVLHTEHLRIPNA